MSLPDRPLAHPSANMQSTADEKAPLLMSEKQQYARLIGAKNRQPHIRSSRRSSVCLAFLLSLLSLAAIATVFLSAANLSYSPDRSLTENVVDWSSTIVSSVKQQISSWIPSHCPSLKESKDMIAKKQQEIMEKSKTMPYAGPIIDSISQFTEIDRMPLELAVIYYKALRSGEEGRMDAFRTFDKITKPSDSSQASSEQQREWQELANERGKALKRIFQILSEENDSNAPVSVDRLVQLLGKPDTVAATVNQDKKLMPGMSPGPYISSEFKPAPEDTDAVMDFIYYGESMQQGMSVKVNEASSVVTGDNISAESGGRDKKKAHSQVLSMSWFNHEE